MLSKCFLTWTHWCCAKRYLQLNWIGGKQNMIYPRIDSLVLDFRPLYGSYHILMVFCGFQKQKLNMWYSQRQKWQCSRIITFEEKLFWTNMKDFIDGIVFAKINSLTIFQPNKSINNLFYQFHIISNVKYIKLFYYLSVLCC